MHARFVTLFIELLGFYFDGMTAVISIILYQAQNGRGVGGRVGASSCTLQCTWFFANALAISQERLTLSNS